MPEPPRPGAERLASCGHAVTLIARTGTANLAPTQKKALEQVVARVLDDEHAFEPQRFLAKATQEDLGLDWVAPALL